MLHCVWALRLFAELMAFLSQVSIVAIPMLHPWLVEAIKKDRLRGTDLGNPNSLRGPQSSHASMNSMNAFPVDNLTSASWWVVIKKEYENWKQQSPCSPNFLAWYHLEVKTLQLEMMNNLLQYTGWWISPSQAKSGDQSFGDYFYFWLQKCSDHLFIETWKIPPVHVVPHQSRSKMAPTARIRQHPRGRVVLPGCGRNGLVEFDLLSGLKFWLDWASISCGECVSRNAWTSKKLYVRMIAARTKPQIHVYANVRSQSESDHPCSFEPNHGGQLDVPLESRIYARL